jgi:A/G-specific adenine glycosylase
MLQQTQVDTVLPFYARFLDRFPTLGDLAASSEEDVLRLWSGLGYYNRARNLRKAAEEALDRHGRVPEDYDALKRLPGIGRYMAGAILSIAFNRPFPVVDGNVRRVLSRYNGWRDPRDSRIWEEAARIVKGSAPRLVNQGMMELGATICTPRNPRCPQCPWRAGCVAAREGTPETIPVPRARARTVRVDLVAVLDSGPRGILMRENAGLWEFPMMAESPKGDLEKLGHCRHAITHHRVEVDVFSGRLGRLAGYRRVRFEDMPVTSLTRKIHSLMRSAAGPSKPART